jgi:hypothetical protein
MISSSSSPSSARPVLLVTGLLAVFIVRYRRRRPDEVTPHRRDFQLRFSGRSSPLPGDGRLLQVPELHAGDRGAGIRGSGQASAALIQYPNGTRGERDSHAAGKPVKLVMSSRRDSASSSGFG